MLINFVNKKINKNSKIYGINQNIFKNNKPCW